MLRDVGGTRVKDVCRHHVMDLIRMSRLFGGKGEVLQFFYGTLTS